MQQKHRVVLINGPPRSGKDTIAGILTRHFEARHIKASAPLKRGLQAIFNIDDPKVLEQNKDEPSSYLFNRMSVRDFQIKLSEDFMKILFGKDIFGRLLVRQMQMMTNAKFTVISDLGFIEELEPLRMQYSRANIYIIYLHRPGRTFHGDSRSYLELDRSWSCYHLHNVADNIRHLEKPIVALLSGLLKLKPKTTILDRSDWTNAEVNAIVWRKHEEK